MTETSHNWLEQLPPGVPPEIALEEIAGTSVMFAITSAEELRRGYDVIDVALPYGCSAQGYVNRPHLGPARILTLHNRRVPEPLRRHGIGERLLRTQLAVARGMGSQEVQARVLNASVMSMLERVLGSDFEVYDRVPRTGSKIDMPISPAQAAASLKRAWGDEPVDLAWQHGRDFWIIADISELNVDGWEIPEPEAYL